jgi:outer membrane protein assembly factor BamB
MATEIAAIDPQTGDLQWSLPHENQWKQNITLPIWDEKDHLLFITSMGPGSKGLKLTHNGKKTEVTEAWANKKVGVHHTNAIQVGDCVYTSTGGAGGGPSLFYAVDIKSGKTKWKELRIFQGELLYADGKLIVLDEDGNLGLVEPWPRSSIIAQTPLFSKASSDGPHFAGTIIFAIKMRSWARSGQRRFGVLSGRRVQPRKGGWMGVGILQRVFPRFVFVIIVTSSSSVTSAQWPQWGGPNRDFKLADKGLAASWPEEGPKRLWTRDLGDGYCCILEDRGVLYTMYRHGDEDVVVALDAKTGKTNWEYAYAASTYKENKLDFGKGPNATPLLSGGRLYTIGFTAKMHCLDAKSGKLLWSHDLIKEFGGKIQEFGYAVSPLLYQKNVIVEIGGKEAGLVAFDAKSGKPIWKSPEYDISYAPPILINVDGEDQIVFMSSTEVIGVSPKDGSALWRHPQVNQYKNNCFMPIWGPDHLLVISSHSDAGTRVLKLHHGDGEKTEVEELWHDTKKKIFHSTAVRVGDNIVGTLGDMAPTFLACWDVKTGKEAWRVRGFPKANCLYVDGKMIVLDEDGMLALAEVSEKGCEIKGKVQLLDKVAWTAPTLVGTKLYVRDRRQIMALELGEPVTKKAKKSAA